MASAIYIRLSGERVYVVLADRHGKTRGGNSCRIATKDRQLRRRSVARRENAKRNLIHTDNNELGQQQPTDRPTDLEAAGKYRRQA